MIQDTTLSGVKVVVKAFEDNRGYFKETYRGSWATDLGLTSDFVQDNISRSYQGTIRGLHYQRTSTSQTCTMYKRSYIGCCRRFTKTFCHFWTVLLGSFIRKKS